ncbi:MAG: HEPN domain-containing protein [Pseudoflavonifractor sp.]
MADSLRYQDWYEKAAHDLRGAKILFQYQGGNDLVTFHCQQAIEKQLKGWLLKATNELNDGHSLVYLCRLAIQKGADLQNDLRDCAYVGQFYIETRYPSDETAPVSEKETKDCLDIAEKILAKLK